MKNLHTQFTFAAKKKLKKKSVLIILLFLPASLLYAQVFFPAKNYPAGTYINPMEFLISLSGNFGECRANHFHSGIDIRTKQVVDQLVHSIGDGYVSRVKIEAGGFGNAIYITHPEGYVSVYAHLNSFFPALQDYVIGKQYESKSWEQDLSFKPQQFPLTKGDFIAWSGTTGSSQAPHLHLEIRDEKTENPLNPLLFFSSLTDTKPPVVKQLALYDGIKSIYEQKPVIIAVQKVKGIYKLSKPLVHINSTSAYFGINAGDYMEKALGTLGVYEMRMYVDDAPFFAWQLDDISYDVTRYMNAMADYKTKKNGGPWIQLCRKLPNDRLKIYKDFISSNGVLDLRDGLSKKVRIEVFDTKGNKSSFEFSIQGKESSQPIANCPDHFIQGKKNTFRNTYMAFTIKEDGLYDDICFTTSTRAGISPYSDICRIHYSTVPQHSYFDLIMYPKNPIPEELKNKMAIVHYEKGNSKKGKAAILTNGSPYISVREFGEYEIVTDQQAPIIKSKLKDGDTISNKRTLSFYVTDETTSVQTCTATVDGEWLRLVQDGHAYYYEMDDHFPFGSHTFTLTATDENGNVAINKYTLTR